jgi:hypothetical protein
MRRDEQPRRKAEGGGWNRSFPRSAWERRISTLCVDGAAKRPQSGQPVRSHVERGNEVTSASCLAPSARRLAPPSSRRGVLLLVVLSMLVLFMLVGTAFLLTSSQYRTAAISAAKADRVGTPPDDLLDRALMQVLRDTNNPSSVVHYHSLLRDLYGTDGFEAVVYSPATGISFDPTIAAQQVTRFAGAFSGTTADQLGPTQGQFVDIYVRELAYKADDPLTPPPVNERSGNYALTAPDARHVLKLDRDASGQPQMLFLPLTKGYYNGCLLTITSGPASGQSARIVDYEYVSDILPTATASSATPFPPKRTTRLFRFRVMSFPRADGLPLQISTSRRPELGDLAGATLIVNGRPYNGTGVGYNPMAAVGVPRLSAVEAMRTSADPIDHPEIALTPNSVYFFAADPTGTDLLGPMYPNPATGTYWPLNPSSVPIANRAQLWKYQSFVGPGDADESYDAADFQNMFQALQTVTPRSQGRVVTTNGTFEVDDTTISGDFLRLDLEDLPLPSFHRPDLVNYWFHRLLMAISSGSPTDDHVQAILQPYGLDGIRDNADDPGIAVGIRDQIVALKRKISLRPLREDNPNFDGSNQQSRPADLSSVNGLVANGNITVPYWEAVGPWDVDNDNDGVPDSVWVDLGDPVQAAEDGTRYKPLYAFLIVDLDSRLNVNAHGLVDDIMPTNLDPTNGAPGNLAHDLSTPGSTYSSNLLAQGTGYGPAEISLRPVFPAPVNYWLGTPSVGNRLEDFSGDGVRNANNDYPVDDYATLLAGRVKVGDNSGSNRPLVTGRHGIDPLPQDDVYISDAGTAMLAFDAAAGITSVSPWLGTIGPPDLLAQYAFFGYPEFVSNYVAANYVPTSFSTPPDLMGRYALGLDYTGQPAYEYMLVGNAVRQAFAAGQPITPADQPLVADSPYELDLSGDRRRDTRADDRILRVNMSIGTTDYFDVAGTLQNRVPGIAADTDDAAFSTADLERILRTYDADAGTLPSRLWDVVGAFDPVRLSQDNPERVQRAARMIFGDSSLDVDDEPQMLVAAQQVAGVNRRLVTTDSYDLPVPGGGMPGYVTEVGPDGRPGRAGIDDDGDGAVDDASETGWSSTDDFSTVMGKRGAQCTIVDLVQYRIWLEMRRDVMRREGWNDAAVMGLNAATYANFLAVVTARASVVLYGEPYTDTNGNGRHDAGESFTDVPLRVSNPNGRNNMYDGAALPDLQAILAPEVIAGRRMDLNRPFGDGQDNGDGLDNDGDGFIDATDRDGNGVINGPDTDGNGIIDELEEVGEVIPKNGIVDDPLEAGEPFLDVDANGKYQFGEPFIDVDGSGAYSPPRDRLWQNLAAEPIGFDYTNGQADALHSQVATAVSTALGVPVQGGVRNLSSQGRQLCARQLYMLMMLLVDEGYVETQNVVSNAEGNVNLLFYVNDIAARRGHAQPTPDDTALALRKLTAQRIAQWAINCVDFRDADDIMTSFEYDENPWDGWGTRDRDGVLIPLDGDIATDENGSEVMAEANLPTQNQAQVIAWNLVAGAGASKVIAPSPLGATPAVAALVTGPTSIAEQTRGVVWGTERPELLITETLALHDRRCTDERGDSNLSIFDSPSPETPPDYDLDQRLKPRGSLFVELYNPWSDDGKKPAELYGQVDIDPNTAGVQPSAPGVLLNRLSNAYVPASVADFNKYSPVWRMAVLQDPMSGRLVNPALQLLQIDPDGFGVDMDRASERMIYFTTGGDTNRANDNNLLDEYQNVGGTLVPRTDNPNVNVWVPPLPYLRVGTQRVPTGRRYFVARTDRIPSGTPGNDVDVPIAPILPGRCAVVGSSGVQLAGPENDYTGNTTPRTPDNDLTTNPLPSGSRQRFVTSLSRLPGTSADEQSDRAHRQHLYRTRRIELWPSPNPDEQQLLIGANGGQEFVPNGAGSYVNVTDSDLPGNLGYGVPGSGTTFSPRIDTNGDGTADTDLIQPCVAIPVEDMNISEPVEGYPSRAYQAAHRDNLGESVTAQAPTLNAEGELEYRQVYDHPLDLQLELVRNGTTQKYRTLHLQRLANPTLPWNPPPFAADGVTANPLHQRNLPVNPYRTIDSQSVDLTAYNGASLYERNALPTAEAEHDTEVDAAIDSDLTQGDFAAPLPIRELEWAPDHVLWALVYLLKQYDIIPKTAPYTTDQFRQSIASNPTDVERRLSELETAMGGSASARARLLSNRGPDQYGRRWDKEWGWSLMPRVLPDDQNIPGFPRGKGDFSQRLNAKSLERGGHYLGIDDPTNANYRWVLDPEWVPRLIWKQERPNFMLLGATQKASDLKNVRSRRVLRGQRNLPLDYRSGDDGLRSTFYQNFGVGGLYPNGLFDDTDEHVFDYVLESTLGFPNEAFAPDLDLTSGDAVALMTTQKPGAPKIVNGTVVATPELAELQQWNPSEAARLNYAPAQEQTRRQRAVQSTYPWLAWNDRPFVSADEIMQVPASSSSLMLRDYSTINSLTPLPYDGDGMDQSNCHHHELYTQRVARQQAPFGHLLNYFMAAALPAATQMVADCADEDSDGNTTELILKATGAPNYSRILDYVEVPSRYVGTDTLLDPAVFNDDPTRASTLPADPDDIISPSDPRYAFQPPFNTVSRERDPGRVNLNTVVGRRDINPVSGMPYHWSEVYDGIMHRYQDGHVPNPDGSLRQLSQFGPAWRDVTLSRRGYQQFNADAAMSPVDKPGPFPDTFTFGLNRDFPTFFANPFRSPDAGDLVPLPSMVEPGVQASWLRSHPYAPTNPLTPETNPGWGTGDTDDNDDGLIDDAREAGFGDDTIVSSDQSGIPLFSETAVSPAIDAERNPYMMYQPMTRLGNLVTTRSGVFAIWITVGYFEVEPADNWDANDNNVQQRFGGNTVAARALYDRVYPEGYMLGREMGIDTGDVKRQRAFFIIDRTQPVGFKPGEDLNVEDTIRVRRRIE